MINKKIILLTFILISFLLNINIINNSVLDATYLFFNNIFVSIFPFIILCDILIYYDYHIFLSKTIGKILSFIFNINENSVIVFILSILTSQPSNSIYIKNLLDKNIINENTANKIITFTYFPSIAFVVGSIGIKLYDNIYVGIILLITNYIYNICIGLYLRNKNSIINIYNDINEKKDSFFIMLKKSIINSFNTCLIILGNIILFSIIINIFNNYIHINPIINSILTGVLELTNGLNNISILNIPLSYKIVLSSFILNFSGLSIIFQSRSILNNYKINIKKIIIIKLLFSLLISIILFIVFQLNIS